MKVGLAAQIACILEATARKPGNVHRLADFPGDAHYLDFLLSAAAMGDVFEAAPRIGLAATVYEAVAATRRVVATNTNLGMILLLAPLAAAAREGMSLREAVAGVLSRTTIDDARVVYRAIRLAHPGGLSDVPDQDISIEPTIPLLQAMRLAEDRDLVARQHARGYADLFDFTLPTLVSALESVTDLESAIVSTYLAMLAVRPDTLIARKRGWAVAEQASRRTREALATRDVDALDVWLRGDGHARNPGATADLIAATLFVALLDGTIELPLTKMAWSPLVGPG
jgi:triphosphoribosyl-dephospho-CoA synthase